MVLYLVLPREFSHGAGAAGGTGAHAMSRFAELTTGDVPTFLAEFGEALSFTPAGASAHTVQAIVYRESRAQVFNEGNAVKDYDVLDVTLSARSEIEGRVSPLVWVRNTTGDTLTVDGETWYVREIMEHNVGGLHKLRCTNKLFPYGNWAGG
jgi:hypothetical protein